VCLQVAFGVPKEEVLRVLLQIAQLPEAGQASDKAGSAFKVMWENFGSKMFGV